MRVLRFGLSPCADARAVEVSYHDGCASFEYLFCGVYRGRVTLAVPGEHNLQNALAALAVAEACRVPFAASLCALGSCHGADRRLTLRGKWQGMTIYEDYAHHPTEIRASLRALRRIMDDASSVSDTSPRLLCVFQPHTYSRTKLLLSDFIEVLSPIKNLMIYKTYPARESYDGAGSAEYLAERVGSLYANSIYALKIWLKSTIREKDIVLFLGAGDIYFTAQYLLKELQ